ncbi:transient receptor potential cation channel subfamily M member-like 2 isoform X3 [Bolinopsis microptera]|uniref:transient receptor potential cation channel subfamily M member-like 2 isoform X3 n=1 Tax=Bolinopsis microptera TaxID=2820187 RepID=UPI00307ABEB9
MSTNDNVTSNRDVCYNDNDMTVCVEDGMHLGSSVMPIASTLRRFRVLMGSHETGDHFLRHPDVKEYWITKHFKGVTCNRFIKDPTDYKDSTLCKCGRYDKDHEKTRFPCTTETDSTIAWTTETCTASFTTNAFGHINFTKVEADVLPKYLRFQHDTDIKLIRELIKDKWNLPKTYLIMVVIGGLGGLIVETDAVNDAHGNGFRRYSHKKRELIEKIKDGLVEAALSTQAWIITSGVDSGVSKLVGEAVGTRRTFTQTIPTLGVAAWGTIRDRNQLEYDSCEGLFPANYTVTEGSRMSGQIALDHNHTAFLLPDFGTHRSYHVNKMCDFKINLEKELKEATKSNLITILIEGGLSSLIEAGERVKNKIPIVVMNGTGRAADLIGNARQLLQRHNGVDDPEFLEELEREFDTHFTKSRDRIGNLTQAFDAIKIILKSKHLVTIWDPSVSDAGKIDKAILLGLINSLAEPDSTQLSSDQTSDGSASQEDTDTCTSRHVREFNQLELAIRWNRLDLAEEHLFKGKDFSMEQLNELLWIALEHKNINFASSILTKGANLKRYLTEKRFWDYLNSKKHLAKSPLKKLMKMHVSHNIKEFNDSFIYEHFFKVIYTISQGVYKCPKKMTPSETCNAVVSKKGMLMKDILSCGLGYNHIKKVNMSNYCKRTLGDLPPGVSPLPDFEDPENLLVLYFVLIYEHDVAKCLWRYSRTPLMLSLICAHVCGWLADQEKRRKEITGEDKVQLRKWKCEWEGLAIKIVDTTNENYDANWVQDLIKHRFYSWGGRSSIEIAAFMNSHLFLGHPGVHKYVTDSWMGSLDPDTSYSNILVGILCTPIFIDIRRFKKIIQPAISEEEIKEKQKNEFISQKKKLTKGDTELGLRKKRSWSLMRSIHYACLKFIWFHRAPVTKYFVNLLIYLSFLMVFFCALVLNDSNQKYLLGSRFKDFSILELTVILYMVSTIPLEMRQVYHSMPSTIKAKLFSYWSNTYNKYDVFSLITLLLSVMTKQGYFTLGKGDKYQMYDMVAYKSLMGLTFSLTTTRLLQFLQINSKMGPKVSTITRMFIDLLFFIFIIAIFIVAYGVATEAIIFPIGKEDGITNLWNIIWRPYVHLFGELALDTLDDQLNIGYCKLKIKVQNGETADEIDYSSCLGDDSLFSCDEDKPCQYARIVVQVFLAIYMMLAAVLMLNLLIAVFSKTYETMTVENRDNLLWKWQRYDLMMEFKQRSAVPFPLSLIAYVLRLVRWLWRRCCSCGSAQFFERREAQKKNDEYKKAQMSLLERECLRNIIKKIEVDAQKERGSDPETEKHRRNDRSVSPLKREIPKPLGYEEELDENEIDGLIAIAEDIQITFTSPTTPPPSGRFNPMEKYLDDILENTCYPRSDSVRFHLNSEKRDWNMSLPNYKPTILNLDVKEELETDWNVSGKNASYDGHYAVEKSYPRNPLGRTGIFGRGHLPRYGPNFKSIPILTRFKVPEEAPKLDTPLEVLVEFPDPANKRYYDLPELDSKADEPLTSGFIKELFSHISSTNASARIQLKKILRRGILIKRGAVDSDLNTDNAWVEVFIASYHDDEELALRGVQFQADSKYGWVTVTKEMFQDKIHARYFERVVYNRRVSQYVGHDVNI